MTDNGLDLTSRRILQILGTDGRASYQAIADEVGLSRPAVMERVKRLEETGYIAGYAARLDRAKVGYAGHGLRRRPLQPRNGRVGRSPGSRRWSDHPSVLECHHVAGEDCFILKVAVPTVDSLEKLIRELRGTGSWGDHPHHDRAVHGIRETGDRPRWRATDGRTPRARRSSPICWSAWSGVPPTWRSGSASRTCRRCSSPACGSRSPDSSSPASSSRWEITSPAARAIGASSRSPACFLLLGGNAVVVWAEQIVESGPASVLRGGRAALDRVLRRDRAGRHQRFTWRVGVGLALGFLGSACSPVSRRATWSQRPAGTGRPDARERVVGAGHRVLEAQQTGRTPFAGAAVQMMVAGTGDDRAGLRPRRERPVASSRSGSGRWSYLILFGSIVGYTRTPTPCGTRRPPSSAPSRT